MVIIEQTRVVLLEVIVAIIEEAKLVQLEMATDVEPCHVTDVRWLTEDGEESSDGE